MMYSRKMMSLAVLAAGWALAQPATVEAKAHPRSNAKIGALARARQAANESPDLGFGTLPLPLPPAAIRLYDRNHRKQGPVPPPIPAILNNPSQNVLNRVALRQAFALELARERALRRADTTNGGIFFTPPLGTPFFPVKNLNLFTYLPVYRAFGITGQ